MDFGQATPGLEDEYESDDDELLELPKPMPVANENRTRRISSHKSLEDVLQSSPIVAAAFKQHLLEEKSVENLDFLQIVAESQRRWPNMPISARRARARLIYIRFIDPNSPSAINISSSQRDALQVECCKARPFGESIDIAVFDESAMEIRRLLELDNLPRFVRSASFIRAMDAVIA